MQKEDLLSCFLPYTDEACAARMASCLADRVSELVNQPEPMFAAAVLRRFRWAQGGVRDALAALMAHAMQTESEVHPAFPEIIGQMSEMELQLFFKIMEQSEFPVLDFYLCLMQKESLLAQLGKDDEVELRCAELVRRTTSFVPDDRYYYVQAGLDNLLRLGLIEIQMEAKKHSLTKVEDERLERIYMTFEPAVTAEAKRVKRNRPYMSNGEVRVQTGMIRLTTLGLLLGRAAANKKES